MLKRRVVSVLLSGLCLATAATAAAAYWNKHEEFTRRFRAQNIRETRVVSAGNRRLSGLFDGVKPDPHFNAKTSLERAKSANRCANASRVGGFLSRLSQMLERSVYASGCGLTGCSGCFQDLATGTCTYSACTNLAWPVTGDNQCSGSQETTTVGCGGNPANGCPNTFCNSSACANNVTCCSGGGGGCTQDNGECSQASDCCSNNCFAGICMSEQ